MTYIIWSFYFRKGDFENSIQQYIETIGFTEPSYVIKKVNTQIIIEDCFKL